MVPLGCDMTINMPALLPARSKSYIGSGRLSRLAVSAPRGFFIRATTSMLATMGSRRRRREP
jgi:hypothetical protein